MREGRKRIRTEIARPDIVDREFEWAFDRNSLHNRPDEYSAVRICIPPFLALRTSTKGPFLDNPHAPLPLPYYCNRKKSKYRPLTSSDAAATVAIESIEMVEAASS